MKQYNKPTVAIVELLISDNIAAIAPKTTYEKNSSSGTYSNKTVAGDFFDYGQASAS